MWVTEREGEVAGFAYTRLGTDADIANGGELKLFYVSPRLQGGGIGLGLFEHAIADLVARGFDPYLYTLAGERRGAGLVREARLAARRRDRTVVERGRISGDRGVSLPAVALRALTPGPSPTAVGEGSASPTHGQPRYDLRSAGPAFSKLVEHQRALAPPSMGKMPPLR